MPEPTPEQRRRLQDVLEAFLAENAVINLSALRTEEAAWNGNILDSLPFMELIARDVIPAPSSVLDVGTGGGFPLLPLAVMLPDTRCVGLDSIGKKMDAVRRIVQAAALTNVELLTGRAEILGHDVKHRGRYDTVVSRAVAALPVLLEYTAPFAAPGGSMVLWKSMHADEEIAASGRAQEVLGCTLHERHVYDLGEEWGQRQLLVFRKDARTPDVYPRPVGTAKRDPIA